MDSQIQKSLFDVPGMDCGAEESLVRMRLGELSGIKSLEFNLPAKELVVYHETALREVEAALASLELGARRCTTESVEAATSDEGIQRRCLWIVLLINLALFAIEMTTGLLSHSMGLVADSLDMLADSMVYGMSLLAVGTTIARKKSVARCSGYLQIILAIVGFVEVLRRFLGFEVLPDYRVMILVSLVALVANAVCLVLLRRAQDREVHIQASMIFTSNDIIINLGVIVAGVLVGWLGSSSPDLIVGGVVFVLVTRGAFRILALSR